MARAAAVLHGVTPLLANRLRWSGPDSWRRFAADQFHHVRARQQRVETLLCQLHHVSAAERVGFIALKGSALHDLKLYLPGQRPMADIDLLVHPRDAVAMTRALQSLGYRETTVTWKHGVFTVDGPASRPEALPFGEYRDAAIKIELHTAIAEQLPVRCHDINRFVLSDAMPPGCNAYPSMFALLLHLLLHAAGNMVGHVLRLIQLYDIALLASRMSAADWEMVAAAPAWALPPLQLTQRYFPESIPAGVLTALRRRCPASLNRLALTRRLSDLSYARLWIQPFPGLEWSASPGETIECIWRRIRPNGAQLSNLGMARKEPWAQNSDLQLSRPRRIVRHLLRWPPRPPTMYVVRAALAAATSDGN